MTDTWAGVLPSGKTTNDWDRYVKAWRALCEPIEELTGIKHRAFDPGVSFRLERKNLDLPIWFLKLVNKGLRVPTQINANLLEALKMLVADYEEIGGEDFYDDAYKQAKEEIRKAEEHREQTRNT